MKWTKASEGITARHQEDHFLIRKQSKHKGRRYVLKLNGRRVAVHHTQEECKELAETYVELK